VTADIATAPATPATPSTPEERERQYSLYQPWLQQDPIPAWTEMRDRCPIAHSEEFGGFWILTRYEDIEWAARSPEIFSNAMLGIPDRKVFPEKMIPIQLDGDEHRTWRRTLSDLFNPVVVDKLTPAIREAAVRAIDGFAGSGRCEFIADFGVPLPAETFLVNFGIERRYLQQLLDQKTWLRREGLPNAKTEDEIVKANQPLWDFFGEALDRRAAEGHEGRLDVFSRLLSSAYEGRALTRDEMINIAFVTMLASLDTTTAALGLQFLYLAEHPEVRRMIATDPARIPRIAEELIRHEPVSTTARVVMQDVERHGVKMRAGDRVLMSWGMSGLDPAVFENPEVVDFDRPSTRHLAFAVGPHRCLGMHLARRIIQVALEEWHARIPEYRIAPGTTPIKHYSPGRGLVGLELVFP
jgi:cytochrome P450